METSESLMSPMPSSNSLCRVSNADKQAMIEKLKLEQQQHFRDFTPLEADNKRLKARLCEAEELTRIIAEEARQLRRELSNAKQTIADNEKRTKELISRSNKNERLVKVLQAELHDLQSRDIALETREKHDALIRSLTEKHDHELVQFQHENDQLAQIAEQAKADSSLHQAESDRLKSQLGQELAVLQSEVKSKQDLLNDKEAELDNFVDRWEKEKEQIRSSRDKERHRSTEIRSKYAELKKWVREYRDHVQEEHRRRLEEQASKFEKILLGYKQKMETAHTEKEQQIQEELIHEHFDQQPSHLNSACEERDAKTLLLTPNDEFRCLPRSVENNENLKSPNSRRKAASASEVMAKVCQNVVNEAKSQLKRPVFIDNSHIAPVK